MSTQEITPAAESRPAKLIVSDNSAISYLMDSAKFEHCYRIAKLMATASLIPDHLKFTGNASNKRELTAEEQIGNCFMIVNQAIRWGIDPFSMAPETYVVGGKLAFQGKLIAAVINGLANLEDRLSYTFSGAPGSDDFTITVSGKIKGEAAPRTVQVRVGSAKTDNQMWKKDPEQKLVYTGATKWARRHCPEIILGIIVDDELEPEPMRDVTPRHTSEEAPKVITGGGTSKTETTPAPAKPARSAKPAPAAAESAAETAPAETAPETPAMPPRATMIADLRTAYRAGGIKTGPEAEEVIRKAGMLPVGVGIAGLKEDADMFAIWLKRDELFVAFPEAPEVQAPTEGGEA